jgi:hypothetical protein
MPQTSRPTRVLGIHSADCLYIRPEPREALIEDAEAGTRPLVACR